MKKFIAFLMLILFSTSGYAKDPFRLKLRLRSAPLPETYKIKVKLGLFFAVMDTGMVTQGKKSTPAESDFVFSEKSKKEYQFEVTYASGEPVFSLGDTLEFVIPGGVAVAPRGLFAHLGYPCEYEIYDGPKLIRTFKGNFGMAIETALSKEVCFRIRDAGKSSNGQDVNVGVGVSECDFDFSKAKRIPR